MTSEVLFKDFTFGRVRFVREETLEGYIHPCAIEDVESLLEKLPAEDLKGIAFIVFHQPTRKAEMASPRWAAYYPEFSRGEISGSAIFLEAVNPSKPAKWKTSLTPDDQRELDYLIAEGHKIERGKRSISISLDIDSTRRTQLERSFIHELGHHVDFKRDPANFSSKSKQEKELFAWKYYSSIKI